MNSSQINKRNKNRNTMGGIGSGGYSTSIYSKSNDRRQKNPPSVSHAGGGGRNVNAEGVYLNASLLRVTSSLVGVLANLTASDGSHYQGLLKTISPQYDVVLESAIKLTTDQSSQDSDQAIGDLIASLVANETLRETMIFNCGDVVNLSFPNVDLEYATKGNNNFTDAEISGFDENAPLKQKDLVPWEGGGGDEYDLSLEQDNKNVSSMSNQNGWDAEAMFRLNEEKYNVSSTYTDDLEGYTVQLDRNNSAEFREIEEQAREIAESIENDQASRKRLAFEDSCENDDIGEEERFSAVIRPSQQQQSSSGHQSHPQPTVFITRTGDRSEPLTIGRRPKGQPLPSSTNTAPPNARGGKGSAGSGPMLHHSHSHHYNQSTGQSYHHSMGSSYNYHHNQSNHHQQGPPHHQSQHGSSYEIRGKQLTMSQQSNTLNNNQSRTARLEIIKPSKYESSNYSNRSEPEDREFYRSSRQGLPQLTLAPGRGQHTSGSAADTRRNPPTIKSRREEQTANELKKFSTNFNLGTNQLDKEPGKAADSTASSGSTAAISQSAQAQVPKEALPATTSQPTSTTVSVTTEARVAETSESKITASANLPPTDCKSEAQESSRKSQNSSKFDSTTDQVKLVQDSSQSVVVTDDNQQPVKSPATTSDAGDSSTKNVSTDSGTVVSSDGFADADDLDSAPDSTAAAIDSNSERLESITLDDDQSANSDSKPNSEQETEAQKLAKKSTLNPNAKEFVLNPNAKIFQPKFTAPAVPAATAAAAAVSAVYSHQHLPPHHQPMHAMHSVQMHAAAAGMPPHQLMAGMQAAPQAAPPNVSNPAMIPHQQIANHPHQIRMSTPAPQMVFQPPYFAQPLQFAMPNHHHHHSVAAGAGVPPQVHGHPAAGGPIHPHSHAHHHAPYILQPAGVQPLTGQAPPTAGQPMPPTSVGIPSTPHQIQIAGPVTSGPQVTYPQAHHSGQLSGNTQLPPSSSSGGGPSGAGSGSRRNPKGHHQYHQNAGSGSGGRAPTSSNPAQHEHYNNPNQGAPHAVIANIPGYPPPGQPVVSGAPQPVYSAMIHQQLQHPHHGRMMPPQMNMIPGVPYATSADQAAMQQLYVANMGAVQIPPHLVAISQQQSSNASNAQNGHPAPTPSPVHHHQSSGPPVSSSNAQSSQQAQQQQQQPQPPTTPTPQQVIYAGMPPQGAPGPYGNPQFVSLLLAQNMHPQNMHPHYAPPGAQAGPNSVGPVPTSGPSNHVLAPVQQQHYPSNTNRMQ